MKRYSQQQISDLLDKFMNGLTTPDEEGVLGDYFRTHDVPEEWEDYRLMFDYFDRGMEGEPVPVQQPQAPLTMLMARRWWGIGTAAAITAAVVGTVLLHRPSTTNRPVVAKVTPIETPAITPTDSTPSMETQDFASLHNRAAVETQNLASHSRKPKAAAQKNARSLKEENARLARENERLQRELADLKRRAFIIDLEANGYKTVLNEDGNIILIDMEQELENELNNKLTTNIPAI